VKRGENERKIEKGGEREARAREREARAREREARERVKRGRRTWWCACTGPGRVSGPTGGCTTVSWGDRSLGVLVLVLVLWCSGLVLVLVFWAVWCWCG
jgi:hypothetical protein